MRKKFCVVYDFLYCHRVRVNNNLDIVSNISLWYIYIKNTKDDKELNELSLQWLSTLSREW